MTGIPERVDLTVGEKRLTVQVRLLRRRGIRRLRVWVAEGEEVKLSVPWHVPRGEAMAFLQTHAAWLAGQLEQHRARPGLLEYVSSQGWVALDGRRWAVCCHSGPQRTRLVVDEGAGQVTLYVNWQRQSAEMLYREFRKLAGFWLVRRTRSLAVAVGADPARITVRDPRTRWGSCSAGGGISLSWKLVLIDPAIQDYVIFHELAHLQELNHSSSFWKLLRTYDGQAREHDQALKEWGRQLNFDSSKP